MDFGSFVTRSPASTRVWGALPLIAGLAVLLADPVHAPVELMLLAGVVFLARQAALAAATGLTLPAHRATVFLGFGYGLIGFEYLGYWALSHIGLSIESAALWPAPRLSEALLLASCGWLARSARPRRSWPMAYAAILGIPLWLDVLGADAPPVTHALLAATAVVLLLNLTVLLWRSAPRAENWVWATTGLQLASTLPLLSATGSPGLILALALHVTAFLPVLLAFMRVAQRPSLARAAGEALLGVMLEPALVVDRRGAVFYANRAARLHARPGHDCHSRFHRGFRRDDCPVCARLREGREAVVTDLPGAWAGREIALVPLAGHPGLFLHVIRNGTAMRPLGGNREFAAVFANTHVALAYVDADLRFICVNRGFAQSADRAPADFVARTMEEMALGASIIRRCRDVLASGESAHGQGECCLLPNPSEQRVWNWSIDPILGDHGQVTHLVIGLLEITQHHRAEEAARLFSDSLRAVQEHVSDGIVIASLDGRVHEVNGVAENLIGYERCQLHTMSVFDFHPTEEHERMRAAFRNLGYGFRVRVELALTRSDGERRMVEVAAAPFRYGDERMVLACLRDVTERQRREELLRQREARCRASFDNGGMGVAAINPQGVFIEFNPAMLRICGCSRDEMPFACWPALFPDAPPPAGFGPGDGPYSGRHRVAIADGQERWVDMTLSPVFDDEAKLVFTVAMLMDASESHRVEQLHVEHEQELARANAWKSRFIAAAGHDIRQPLQAMSILVQLLQERTMDEPARAIADRMRMAVTNLTDMVNSVLDLSKLDAGLIVPEFEPVRLDRIFAALDEQYRDMAHRKGLAFSAEPGGECWVQSDRRLLTRILSNLVSNAVRYTEHGAVHISCSHDHDAITVTVADSGIGIPAEECARIFEEFHQSPNNLRHGEGMGLGLAIVDNLARMLGVVVKVVSDLGAGTKFTVRIPWRPFRQPPGPERQLVDQERRISGLRVSTGSQMASRSGGSPPR